MRQKAILGVDLGGTKIMCGLVTSKGKVLGKPYTIPTGGLDTKKNIINRLFYAIEQALSNARLNINGISGIGIGATGPLDMKEGLILECPFLPNLNNYPIREVVHERFDIPVLLENDANCFVLGECYFGSGKGYETVMGYTLGTGLGCATVINRKIFSGATQHACEVWSSPYHNKTIEDFVSGRGISRMYKDLSGKNKSAREISQLAYHGDKQAKQTWEDFGEHLSCALSWGINTIDPGIVILGGSIANSMDLFAPSMERFLRKYICKVPAEKTKVVKTMQGEHAGFIGAACLVIHSQT
jgi:glucokinase